jgi:hypothetical protein
MKLDGLRSSSNVEDRRGRGGERGAIGLGTVVVVVGVSWLLGLNPIDVLQGLSGGGGVSTVDDGPPADPNDPAAVFSSKILASTEDTWGPIFQRMGRAYQEPHLVLFRDGVDSACGFAESAVGPFYCPGDDQLYLDLTFFDELDQRFGAPGDFAQAYVIAHEVGHHVQNLLGQNGDGRGANGGSVRQELQADCYAGVWGAAARQRGILDAGDLDEALRAATAIGDDTLQRRARGRVAPDSFTHGTSDQRRRWFKRGFDTGDPSQCDTFRATSL